MASMTLVNYKITRITKINSCNAKPCNVKLCNAKLYNK